MGGRLHEAVSSAEGEAIGLVLQEWGSYGRRAPVVFFSEAAQSFVVDNMDAVIAIEEA